MWKSWKHFIFAESWVCVSPCSFNDCVNWASANCRERKDRRSPWKKIIANGRLKHPHKLKSINTFVSYLPLATIVRIVDAMLSTTYLNLFLDSRACAFAGSKQSRGPGATLPTWGSIASNDQISFIISIIKNIWVCLVWNYFQIVLFISYSKHWAPFVVSVIF